MTTPNGKGWLVGKISAVLGTITAILVLYWQLGDRVQNRIDAAVGAVETRVYMKVDHTEKGLVASLNEFRRQQLTQYWMNIRDQARTQLRRVERELARTPRDAFLRDESTYWDELYHKSNQELDKLLNP